MSQDGILVPVLFLISEVISAESIPLSESLSPPLYRKSFAADDVGGFSSSTGDQH